MKPLHVVLCTVLVLVAGCGGNNNNLQIPQGPPPLPLAIDVQTVAIDGDFLLDGVLFPQSPYESGIIYFTHTDGSMAMLGETRFGNYARTIIAGTYASAYQHVDGGSTVPLNPWADVTSGLNLNVDQTLDVDVTAVEVVPQFTLNGGAFPVSGYDNARFLLRPTSGAPSILLGESHLNNASILVVPDTYDVVYQLMNGGDAVPINQNAVVMAGVVISSRTVLAIDVSTVDSRSVFTLDGVAFPFTQYDYGDFLLRNPTTGDVVALGRSYETGTINPIIEGTYDVVYQYSNGQTVPVNEDAIIAAGITVDSGSSAVSVDVQTATITPSFTQNGGAFPASGYNRGVMYLRGSTEDDLVELGSTNVPPDPIRIVRGDYSAYYSFVQGDGVPVNPWAEVASGLVLNADQALPIDVETAIIEPSFALNGGAFPVTEYDDAEFELRNVAEPMDRFYIGDSYQNNNPEPVRVVEGTYDVLYRFETGGEKVPSNSGRVVQPAVPLFVSQLLPINVEAKQVAATFTLDGGAFPVSPYNSGLFWLRDPTNGDEIYLGRSNLNKNAPVMVMFGTYDVLYEFLQGNGVPVNEFTKVGTVNVQ